MSIDPLVLREARSWTAKAETDLRCAQLDLAANPPVADDALFHCQQAAEKALKGFLALHNRPFRKTHNLEELGEACLAIDPSLRDLVNEVVPLTEYAWMFRYPGDPPPLEPGEATAAFALTQRFITALCSRFPQP